MSSNYYRLLPNSTVVYYYLLDLDRVLGSQHAPAFARRFALCQDTCRLVSLLWAVDAAGDHDGTNKDISPLLQQAGHIVKTTQLALYAPNVLLHISRALYFLNQSSLALELLTVHTKCTWQATSLPSSSSSSASLVTLNTAAPCVFLLDPCHHLLSAPADRAFYLELLLLNNLPSRALTFTRHVSVATNMLLEPSICFAIFAWFLQARQMNRLFALPLNQVEQELLLHFLMQTPDQQQPQKDDQPCKTDFAVLYLLRCGRVAQAQGLFQTLQTPWVKIGPLLEAHVTQLPSVEVLTVSLAAVDNPARIAANKAIAHMNKVKSVRRTPEQEINVNVVPDSALATIRQELSEWVQRAQQMATGQQMFDKYHLEASVQATKEEMDLTLDVETVTEVAERKEEVEKMEELKAPEIPVDEDMDLVDDSFGDLSDEYMTQSEAALTSFKDAPTPRLPKPGSIETDVGSDSWAPRSILSPLGSPRPVPAVFSTLGRPLQSSTLESTDRKRSTDTQRSPASPVNPSLVSLIARNTSPKVSTPVRRLFKPSRPLLSNRPTLASELTQSPLVQARSKKRNQDKLQAGSYSSLLKRTQTEEGKREKKSTGIRIPNEFQSDAFVVQEDVEGEERSGKISVEDADTEEDLEEVNVRLTRSGNATPVRSTRKTRSSAALDVTPVRRSARLSSRSVAVTGRGEQGTASKNKLPPRSRPPKSTKANTRSNARTTPARTPARTPSHGYSLRSRSSGGV